MFPARPVRISSIAAPRGSIAAARIIPGVQMPHCAPPSRTNASWSGCEPPSPSIVVTTEPRAWANGTRQEFTGWPSTITVHAPHSPSPHPSFVPVSPHSSRKTSRRRFIGGAETSRLFPLSVNLKPWLLSTSNLEP